MNAPNPANESSPVADSYPLTSESTMLSLRMDSVPLSEGPDEDSSPDPRPVPDHLPDSGSDRRAFVGGTGDDSDSPSAEIERSGQGQRRRRPTIEDVAAKAEVSTATVSNYLNQRGRMAPTTGARIRCAIEALNYTPSALMRALRQRQTHILGVYIGGLDNLDENPGESVTLSVLAGINRGATAGANNILQFTGYEDQASRRREHEFLDGHIDGLIWVAPPRQSPTLERLASAGLPVISLLSRHVPDGVGYVNGDNLGAVRKVVSHLADRGHRRIAYVGPIHDSNYSDRRDGYRYGLADRDITWDSALEINLTIEEGWSQEAFDRIPVFDELVDRWMAAGQLPTAAILPDDGLALSFCRVLQRRGIRIPEDMAIAGFSDIPDAATAFGGLTTVRQPLRQMGQMAAERLLALIGGAPVSECRVTAPADLVIRASTGTAGSWSQ